MQWTGHKKLRSTPKDLPSPPQHFPPPPLTFHFKFKCYVYFYVYSSVQDFMCDCFWLQRSVYNVWHAIPSLKPETMPLNQGVKKNVAIVTQLPLESFVNILMSDLLIVRVKKMYMKENSVFNFSCLKLILSIIKHPEKKPYRLCCHLM